MAEREARGRGFREPEGAARGLDANSSNRSRRVRRIGVRRGADRTTAQQRLAFVAGAAIPVYLALNGGGYDLILRHQAALILWWGLALAFAFGFLPAARVSARTWIALGLLAALIGWTALSLGWTESRERTFDELSRLVGYAGLVVLVLSAVNRKTFRHAAAGIALALLAVPVLALLSRLAPELFPGDSLAGAFGGDRLLYPLGYWNALACWCAMAVAVGLSFSAHAGKWRRQAALSLVPVAAAALYLTYSRAGILAALFGCLVVVAYSRARWTLAIHSLVAVAASALIVIVIQGQPEVANGTGREGWATVAISVAAAAVACWMVADATRTRSVDRLTGKGRPRLWSAAAAVGLAVLAVLAVGFVGPRVTSQGDTSLVTDASHDADPSSRLIGLDGVRPEIWSSALRAARDEPITGIGPGAFEFWWTRDVSSGDELRDAHSLYVETLAELGLPGLVLLVGFLGFLVGAGLEARRRPYRSRDLGALAALLAAGAVFLFHAGVDWMWEMGAVAATGLVALAVAAGAGSDVRNPRRALGISRGVFVAAAVLAGAVQIPGLVATERLRTSGTLLVDGFEGRAAELASVAADAEPWAASARAQSAWVALHRSRYAEARREVQAAIEREPTNWRHRFLLLRVQLARADRDGALDALDEVVRLNPSLETQAARIRESIVED